MPLDNKTHCAIRRRMKNASECYWTARRHVLAQRSAAHPAGLRPSPPSAPSASLPTSTPPSEST